MMFTQHLDATAIESQNVFGGNTSATGQVTLNIPKNSGAGGGSGQPQQQRQEQQTSQQGQNPAQK